MGKINSTNATGYTRRRHARVFARSSYWRRQESPRLLDQQLADDAHVKTFPSGRIVGDDADRWLREHS